jgi:hypothetical protein
MQIQAIDRARPSGRIKRVLAIPSDSIGTLTYSGAIHNIERDAVGRRLLRGLVRHVELLQNHISLTSLDRPSTGVADYTGRRGTTSEDA